MVGGRLSWLSCFFPCNAVLLLGVCLYDVEASICQHVVHTKVGDTVEFSSCLPTEGVTAAIWRYGKSIIAAKDRNISKEQFEHRLKLNPTNFSLTVKRLTVQDSGDFAFVSETNNTQRETITINLQVHEPITTQPVLTSNSTWHGANTSCTVWLECSTTSNGSVTYNWTVRNETRDGARQQYIVRAQDGDTRFTCTVSNFVSEMSASETVTCSNETQEIKTLDKSAVNFVTLLSLAGGACLLIVVVVGISVCVCHSKQSQAVTDSNDLTVYADITEVATEDMLMKGYFNFQGTMKPCSMYETIDNIVNPVTPAPLTVYDKIQLSRVRMSSVSPYQDIS